MKLLPMAAAPWCMRLDYDMGKRHYHTCDYPARTPWGKGMLDVSLPAYRVRARHKCRETRQ